MLRQYENSIDDKRQFTALVKDIFPEEAKNINLILMAYNMGIAQDIQKANLLNNTFAFRYKGDVVVSQDYGVAAMALGKGLKAKVRWPLALSRPKRSVDHMLFTNLVSGTRMRT